MALRMSSERDLVGKAVKGVLEAEAWAWNSQPWVHWRTRMRKMPQPIYSNPFQMEPCLHQPESTQE